jgi:tRNA A-37 threonylcarbamoyl transferase component Bud32/tetratricopeptide (TPR) repeat protein
MRQRYGRWEVRATLGRGGMGDVFRAEDPATGRLAAVKVARVRRAARDALRREIGALERLRHPGIVRFLEHGVEDEEVWVATELVVGEPLRDRVAHTHPSSAEIVDTVLVEDATARERTWETPERRSWTRAELAGALSVVRRMCDPLGWLHGQGFVHGDVKPENVIVRPDGRVVLVDLGLVRAFEVTGRDTLDVERRISGTVGYLSPEQCAGRAPDGRSDLYALGCVLFELLCGTPPFGHGSAAAWSHQSVPAPSIRDWCDVPAELDALVARLLEKEPRRRLAYASDVAESLEALGVPAPADPGPPARRVLYRPRLAGREDVLDRLRTARVAIVAGGPGAGKTRVLATLGEEREPPTVAGVASAPGGLAASVVRSLVSAVPPERAARWFGHAPTLLAALDPRVAELLGERRPAEPASDGAVVAAVERALASAAPLRLLLDDLGSADARDASLCLRLARHPPDDVSVLLAEPSGPLREALGRLGVPVVALEPLSDDAVDELLRDALGDDDAPPELLAFVRARAAGNPRFAWEYAQELVAAGELRRRRGQWVIRDRDRLDGSAVPAGVEGLARARFDGLGDALQRVAGHAAIAGPDALPDDVCDALGGARILERTSSGWRFVAPILADLARATLTPAERARAHREALARLPADASDAVRSEHLLGAGETAAARAALLRMVAEATRATRWSAVVRACDEARALPDTPPEVDAELRVALARAHRARGHFEAAVAVLAGLEEDLATPLGREVRFHRARALARTSAGAEAVALLQDALARDRTDPVRWLEALGETFAERGALVESIAARRRVIALLSEQPGEPARLARAQVALANALQRQDRLIESRALLDAALPVLDGQPELSWRGHARASSALAWTNVDEDRVKRDALLAIGHYRTSGFVANEAQVIGVLVDCLRRRREDDEAHRWLARMEALADEIGSERLQAQAITTRCSMLFAERHPGAAETLSSCLPRVARSGFTTGEAMVRRSLCVLLREAGRWDEIEPHLDRLHEIAAARDDLGMLLQEAAERTWLAIRRGTDVSAALAATNAAASRVEQLDDEDRALLAALTAAVAALPG